MPKIPSYTRGSKIQPQAVAPRVSQNAFTGSGRAMQEVGESLLKMEKAISEARDLNQLTAAEIEQSKRTREDQFQALQDPNLDENLATHVGNIRKSTAETAKTISSPTARAKFLNKATLHNTALEFDLGVEARKNMSRKAKENVTEMENVMMAQVYEAPNETIRREKILAFQNIVREHMATGMIDGAKGREAIDGFNDRSRAFWLNQLIDSGRAEDAFKILDSGEHGIEDATVAKNLLKASEKKIKADDAAGKASLSDAKDRNEIDLFDLHMEGNTTQALYDKAEDEGDIGETFADDMRANLLSPLRYVEEGDADVNVSLALTRKALGGKTPKGARVLMHQIIQANTDGKITLKKMKYLGSIIAGEYQNDAAKYRNSLIGKAMNGIKNWNWTMGDGNPETEREMQEIIIQRTSGDEPLTEAGVSELTAEVIDQTVVSQRPELLTASKDVVGIADEGGLTTLRDDKLSAELTRKKAAAEARGRIYVREIASGGYGDIAPEDMDEKLYEAV